jgi:hypothetical protein
MERGERERGRKDKFVRTAFDFLYSQTLGKAKGKLAGEGAGGAGEAVRAGVVCLWYGDDVACDGPRSLGICAHERLGLVANSTLVHGISTRQSHGGEATEAGGGI